MISSSQNEMGEVMSVISSQNDQSNRVKGPTFTYNHDNMLERLLKDQLLLTI